MINLKNVLLVNAISSGLTGILLVELATLFADLFEATSTTPFIGAGIFLVVFALFVGGVALRKATGATSVRIIIALDTAWVIASLIVVAFQLFSLSMIGYALISAVAVWVALMAFLQAKTSQQIFVQH